MIGIGYDIHRLEDGRRLVLGGVEIESDKGAVAHSDGDVLLHALCDAMLGAVGEGDIGEWFPDTDSQWKNCDSSVFVKKCREILAENNCEIVNVDCTLILESPKLKHNKSAIKQNIAELLQLPEKKVGIKATTNEKVGFIGRGEGIAAICVCLLRNIAE